MPKLTTQFVTCSKCAGVAKESENKVCSECGGMGLGTFIKNDFLYWGYDMTPAKIIVRQSRIIFNWTINIIILLVGIGGIGALLLWLKDNAVAENGKIYTGIFFSFWGIKNGLILFFWIGLLLLLFFYFRYIRDIKAKPLVKFHKYRSWQRMIKKNQIVPNNWRELKSFKTKIDVSKSYTKDLLTLLDEAYALAVELKHKQFLPAHVLLTAIAEPENKKESVETNRVKSLFAKLDIYKGKIGPKLENELKNLPIIDEQDNSFFSQKKEISPMISTELRRCLIDAYLQAMDNKNERVEILDLINSLSQADPYLNKVLSELEVKQRDIENVAEWLIINDRYSKNKYEISANKSKIFTIKNKFDHATSAVATPVLNHFCSDLTQDVKTLWKKTFVGRAGKVEEIFSAYSNKQKAIVLVGRKGVGKMTIIKHITAQINKDDVPRVLYRKRVVKLDIKKLEKEVPDVETENKLLVMILELTKATNTILVVEDMTDNLWKIFNDYVGTFYLLATSEKDILNENVKNIKINEPVGDELLMIVASQVVELEDKYKISFNYGALTTAVESSAYFLPEQTQPTKTIELLKKIAINANEQRQNNIDSAFVAKFVAKVTGLPYTKILKHEN